MSAELFYTSAQKGLRPGTRGFCTVIASEGMPPSLSPKLETLSSYNPLFTRGPEKSSNPVSYSHVIFKSGANATSVLSRVADYKADYSGRTNLIAHHVVPTQQEIQKAGAGPAWVLSQPRIMRTEWDGNCQTTPSGPGIPIGSLAAEECMTWKQLTGDSGWGGVVAEAFHQANGKPTYIVYSLEQRFELLKLLSEAIALLPEQERWRATFTTYNSPPPGYHCQVRCVVEGSADARLASGRGKTISLVGKNETITETDWVRKARGIFSKPTTRGSVSYLGTVEPKDGKDGSDGSSKPRHWAGRPKLITPPPPPPPPPESASGPEREPELEPVLVTDAELGRETAFKTMDFKSNRKPKKLVSVFVAASLFVVLVLSVIFFGKERLIAILPSGNTSPDKVGTDNGINVSPRPGEGSGSDTVVASSVNSTESVTEGESDRGESDTDGGTGKNGTPEMTEGQGSKVISEPKMNITKRQVELTNLQYGETYSIEVNEGFRVEHEENGSGSIEVNEDSNSIEFAVKAEPENAGAPVPSFKFAVVSLKPSQVDFDNRRVQVRVVYDEMKEVTDTVYFPVAMSKLHTMLGKRLADVFKDSQSNGAGEKLGTIRLKEIEPALQEQWDDGWDLTAVIREPERKFLEPEPSQSETAPPDLKENYCLSHQDVLRIVVEGDEITLTQKTSDWCIFRKGEVDLKIELKDQNNEIVYESKAGETKVFFPADNLKEKFFVSLEWETPGNDDAWRILVNKNGQHRHRLELHESKPEKHRLSNLYLRTNRYPAISVTKVDFELAEFEIHTNEGKACKLIQDVLKVDTQTPSHITRTQLKAQYLCYLHQITPHDLDKWDGGAIGLEFSVEDEVVKRLGNADMDSSSVLAAKVAYYEGIKNRETEEDETKKALLEWLKPSPPSVGPWTVNVEGLLKDGNVKASSSISDYLGTKEVEVAKLVGPDGTVKLDKNRDLKTQDDFQWTGTFQDHGVLLKHNESGDKVNGFEVIIELKAEKIPELKSFLDNWEYIKDSLGSKPEFLKDEYSKEETLRQKIKELESEGKELKPEKKEEKNRLETELKNLDGKWIAFKKQTKDRNEVLDTKDLAKLKSDLPQILDNIKELFKDGDLLQEIDGTIEGLSPGKLEQWVKESNEYKHHVLRIEQLEITIDGDDSPRTYSLTSEPVENR